jgi:hypothetical protein
MQDCHRGFSGDLIATIDVRSIAGLAADQAVAKFVGRDRRNLG